MCQEYLKNIYKKRIKKIKKDLGFHKAISSAEPLFTALKEVAKIFCFYFLRSKILQLRLNILN